MYFGHAFLFAPSFKNTGDGLESLQVLMHPYMRYR